MTFSRILASPLLAAAVLAMAAPAMAATGPFTVTESVRPDSVILVIDSVSACATQDAALEATLAAQAGRAVGVIANDSACGAARAVMDLDSAPALAFAGDAAALGPRGEPNAFLARNRDAGIYVWSLESWRRLPVAPARQVLGVFEGETQGAMIEAAIARLSQHPDGYFLLVQAETLDDAALRALSGAQAQGASIIAPDLLHEVSLGR